jgi:antitoxin MazE
MARTVRLRIARWGKSAAVRLPKPVLAELGVDIGQELDLTIENGEARLCPARRYPRVTLAAILAEMDRLGPANRPETVEWGPDVGAEIIRDDYSRG